MSAIRHFISNTKFSLSGGEYKTGPLKSIYFVLFHFIFKVATCFPFSANYPFEILVCYSLSRKFPLNYFWLLLVFSKISPQYFWLLLVFPLLVTQLLVLVTPCEKKSWRCSETKKQWRLPRVWFLLCYTF